MCARLLVCACVRVTIFGCDLFIFFRRSSHLLIELTDRYFLSLSLLSLSPFLPLSLSRTHTHRLSSSHLTFENIAGISSLLCNNQTLTHTYKPHANHTHTHAQSRARTPLRRKLRCRSGLRGVLLPCLRGVFLHCLGGAVAVIPFVCLPFCNTLTCRRM